MRDDESCGRSKEVRTPELIGQIKNFMDKDHCVSMETISAHFDVSVGTVHTIIREELKMRKMYAKFVPMKLTYLQNYSLEIFSILSDLHDLYIKLFFQRRRLF